MMRANTKEAQKPSTSAIPCILQPKCGLCSKKRRQLQRSPDGQRAPESTSIIVHEAIHSPGQPLDREARDFFEPRFGHDFGQVRIHADALAAESARTVNALAFTVGQDIVFGSNRYYPGTFAGRKLLAHELTHIVQQQSKPVLELDYDSHFQNSQSIDAAEHEAEAVSAAVLIGRNSGRINAVPNDTLQRCGGRQQPYVSPEIADIPGNRYVDAFTSVHYSLDYRSVGGNLSTWLQVHYGDGTIIDISIYDIVDECMDPRDALESMAQGYVGEGGRIFPRSMNSLTVPRLHAAKISAIETMEEYNYEFIQGTIPAVFFIITMAIGLGGSSPRPTRTTVRLQRVGRPTQPSASSVPSSARGGPSTGGGRSPSSTVPETGSPGSREASVRAAHERAAQRPTGSPLPANQQVIRDTILREHGGLHPNVATEAARGGSRAMGPSGGAATGGGADIVLINGGGREVSVHSGAFTPQSIGSHLQAEAMQRGTTEIFMQINSSGASRQGMLQMISALRTGYRELSGKFVKIFGPNGEVWWNGIFRGP